MSPWPAHRIAALYALDHGGDVESELAKGQQALRERAKYNGETAVSETLRASLLLVQARFLVQQRKPALAPWALAHAAAQKAAQLDADDPAARLILAELVRYQLELKQAAKHQGMALLGEGLAAAARTCKQQPWNTSAQATQAALRILGARLPENRTQRSAQQTEGAAALVAALKQNPRLAIDFKRLLPDAAPLP